MKVIHDSSDIRCENSRMNGLNNVSMRQFVCLVLFVDFSLTQLTDNGTTSGTVLRSRRHMPYTIIHSEMNHGL